MKEWEGEIKITEHVSGVLSVSTYTCTFWLPWGGKSLLWTAFVYLVMSNILVQQEWEWRIALLHAFSKITKSLKSAHSSGLDNALYSMKAMNTMMNGVGGSGGKEALEATTREKWYFIFGDFTCLRCFVWLSTFIAKYTHLFIILWMSCQKNHSLYISAMGVDRKAGKKTFLSSIKYR